MLYASAEEIILACKNNKAQIAHSTLDASEVAEFNAQLAQLTLNSTAGKDVTLAFMQASGFNDVEFANASTSLNVYKQEFGYLFN
jgi:hypothetical protein